MKTLLKILAFIAAAVAGYAAVKCLRQKGKVEEIKEEIEEEVEDFISQHIRPNKPLDNTWGGFFRQSKVASLLLVAGVASFLWNVPFLGEYSHLFKTSLVRLEPTEFTGTVSPIEKVPNWIVLSDAERTMTYDQLPTSKLIPIPKYNPNALRNGVTWDGKNNNERNAWLTYPVPYMGNYQLDGTENTGSHPGTDIKVPMGTPIHSIANGIVYKTENSPTGYGKHIVIAHVGIPDPENPGKTTTLFSGYAHLSQINVTTGQKVAKGQVIGKSGKTGMTTGPHLHFQIDRKDAPFYPYWPFTWKDVQSAGLDSYFDAVEQGVGKSKALQYTTNPMNMVAQFGNYIQTNLVATAGESTQTKSPTTTPEPKHTSAPKPTTQITELAQTPSPSESTTRKIGQITVEFQTDRGFVPGKIKVVQISVNEAALVASAGIELSTKPRNTATLSPAVLTKEDFKNGIAQVEIKPRGDKQFRLVASGDWGEAKSERFRPQIFTDVKGSHTYADAIKYLKETGIVQGYNDGSFKPEGTLNRAEAVKILLVGNDITVETNDSVFPDVKSTDWFAGYVNTAALRKIIKGYGNGQFRPANTISRAEFLKVAILTAGFEGVNTSTKPYPDVNTDAWFAPFFQFSKEHELLRMKRGGFITPSVPISRAEAADVMYRLSRLKK